MSNVRRGHDTERRCARELKALGYDVIRSAASKSVWDIVAINQDYVLLVQCKRTKKTNRASMAPKSTLDKMRRANSPRRGVVKKQLWTWVDRAGWNITTII